SPRCGRRAAHALSRREPRQLGFRRGRARAGRLDPVAGPPLRRQLAVALLTLGALWLALGVDGARCDLTFRHPAHAPRWPAGTDTVRVRIEDGMVHIPTTLVSASGNSVSGLLTLDTGCPILAVRQGVWDGLKVDTLAMHGAYWSRVPRPLAWVEMGTARL